MQHTQLALPGLGQIAPNRKPGEALRILQEMFDIIRESTGQDSRACFNLLVRFLADCLRIHPLPQEDREVAAKLLPLAIPYFEACAADPWDWLGELFEQQECGNRRLGQNFTPRPVVRFMVTLAMLKAPKAPDDGSRFITVLDPCTGTGRFLVATATMFPDKPLALFGIEIDIDLYRAALVNMRTFALGRPYLLLRADALVVDASLDSPNWRRYGNLWNPPHWSEMKLLVDQDRGREFAKPQEK